MSAREPTSLRGPPQVIDNAQVRQSGVTAEVEEIFS
jgi:hypothetical protein